MNYFPAEFQDRFADVNDFLCFFFLPECGRTVGKTFICMDVLRKAYDLEPSDSRHDGDSCSADCSSSSGLAQIAL